MFLKFCELLECVNQLLYNIYNFVFNLYYKLILFNLWTITSLTCFIVKIPSLICFIVTIPIEEHFSSKAACISHLIVIENIKKKLNKEQLEMLKNYCFGYFLFMLELKFSAHIVHHMLFRQCLIKKDDEMWFLVNSKALRFGQDEFELISGLSFGLIPQHNET